MPRGGLKILGAADFADFDRFVLLAAEILQVRGAKAAADLLDVEGDVGHMLVVERREQEAAKMFAAGATEPRPPPDFTNAVDSRIPPAVDGGESICSGAVWVIRYNRSVTSTAGTPARNRP